MPAAQVTNPSVLSNPQTLQSWSNLLQSLFGTSEETSGSETTVAGSAATDPIMALLAQILPGATGGVNNPEIQQLLTAIFTQFKEGAGGLSGIQGAANTAGVYNSTTQGLLANDALARAVAQSAGVVGTFQNQRQQTAANLLNTLMQGTRGTRTNRQSSTQRGGSLGGNAGKAAMGAAAGAAAAKAAQAIAKAYNNRSQGLASEGDQGGDEGYLRSPTTDRTLGDGEDQRESGASNWWEDQPAGGGGMEFDAWDSGNSPDNFDIGSGAEGSDFSNFDIGDFFANEDSSPDFSFLDVEGDMGGGGSFEPEFVDYGDYF